MSTSFWFQGVPCVACFVVCPHFVFKFGFASVGAHSTAAVCAMCVYSVFGTVTRLVVVLPSESKVVQHGCTLC